jgi:hypothetical protein
MACSIETQLFPQAHSSTLLMKIVVSQERGLLAKSCTGKKKTAPALREEETDAVV